MCKRMINPEVVESGKFKRMPHEAQLLYYWGLLTQDVDGITDFSALAYDNHIDESAIAELENAGFILKVGEDLWAITDWKRHNTIRVEAFHKHKPESKKIKADENARYFLCDELSQNFVPSQEEGEEKEKVIPLLNLQETETEKEIVENPVENVDEPEKVEEAPVTEFVTEPVNIGSDIVLSAKEYNSIKSEDPDFDAIAPEVARRTARALAKKAYTSVANLVRHIVRADGENIRRYATKQKTSAYTGRRDYEEPHGSFDTEDFWNAAIEHSHQMYREMKAEEAKKHAGSFDTEDFWNAAVAKSYGEEAMA